MNCFITHTPFTSTWLIPERDIEWARAVYGVEKDSAPMEELQPKKSLGKPVREERQEPVGILENEWRYVV